MNRWHIVKVKLSYFSGNRPRYFIDNVGFHIFDGVSVEFEVFFTIWKPMDSNDKQSGKSEQHFHTSKAYQ